MTIDLTSSGMCSEINYLDLGREESTPLLVSSYFFSFAATVVSGVSLTRLGRSITRYVNRGVYEGIEKGTAKVEQVMGAVLNARLGQLLTVVGTIALSALPVAQPDERAGFYAGLGWVLAENLFSATKDIDDLSALLTRELSTLETALGIRR